MDTGDKDSTYYKTLLAGMKKDFTAELEKIKGHLTKERFRYIIENETMNLMLIIHVYTVYKKDLNQGSN